MRVGSRFPVGSQTSSVPAGPAGSGSSDYTLGNLIRLGLAILVLISLATLLVLDWRSSC